MAKPYEEMFQHYKDKLLAQAKSKTDVKQFFDGTVPPQTGWTRYAVVEYVCSFPKLDPVRMVAELINEGIKIYFDNSAISREENMRLEHNVGNFLKKINGKTEG